MSASELRIRIARLESTLSSVQKERDELLHEIFSHEVILAYLDVY